MEMKKVACAVLAAAASATVVLAAEAPAPAPTSASSAAFPAVGAVLGASVLSFFAYYLQFDDGVRDRSKSAVAYCT
uniref:Pollen-specific arabinogalacta protein BAN102 n=2 Tax=Zea mays TaxID=4577 RepID=A0A804R460_MAIZE